ncbi:ATP-binding protein [Aliiglaciecola sp. LCG003]|uniref:sensor histidine kinase n=1 Tax=Aliiglaciecola sp. LCG003 TaxID=3053655 RepID=UPI0025724E67|nr:ATP-binding protein [Aliiglaciecola sp. LCG003]WJG10604.1 ATP-binding protein [Aliiglaciecola sp. LCG003]
MALGNALRESFNNILVSADFSSVEATDTRGSDTKNVSLREFEQLQTQATRLEHLLQVMPAGVVVVNGRGIVKQANAVAKDLLGEPLEGQKWRMIISRSFKPQADDGHEVSLHDGRKVKLSITPLTQEPGQLIVLTDLTETRQLQQRIGHMQRLSSLGKTVASIVHQIRTPLSAALLYASNLASNKLTDAARTRFSEKLILRLKDLESQVNDMLLFAKSGEQQVVQSLDIDTLFNDVYQASENMLSQSNATLSIKTSQNSGRILGNKPALVGAIQNLIHNGIQVQKDAPHIQLRAYSEAQSVFIEVVDHGPGVEPDNMPHIFEPFFTSKSHGTGLGLAVVATVAKSHGGTVSVHNCASKGACFTMQLPMHIDNQAVQAQSSIQSLGEQL